MAKLSHFSFIVLFFLFLAGSGKIGYSQDFPARLDGFVYKNRNVSINTVMIEAFFDPVCPDSKDSWPPLKHALEHYGDRVSLTVHPFPLPFHDNAFVTSRALHIVDKLNKRATYDLLELFFKHQEEFDTEATFNFSRDEIVSRVVKLATTAVGDSYHSDIKTGFTDTNTDLSTRVSFEYGCSRGVFGTPFFYVNGFLLPDAGSPLTYKEWRNTIDPLLKAKALILK